jgi:hypothetical protein
VEEKPLEGETEECRREREKKTRILKEVWVLRKGRRDLARKLLLTERKAGAAVKLMEKDRVLDS